MLVLTFCSCIWAFITLGSVAAMGPWFSTSSRVSASQSRSDCKASWNLPQASNAFSSLVCLLPRSWFMARSRWFRSLMAWSMSLVSASGYATAILYFMLFSPASWSWSPSISFCKSYLQGHKFIKLRSTFQKEVRVRDSRQITNTTLSVIVDMTGLILLQ